MKEEEEDRLEATPDQVARERRRLRHAAEMAEPAYRTAQAGEDTND
ncbi:hypothetical protein GCM10009839_18120 [Catenulispora yoronensis]|uniref:Uncharacterized protein n=1 Tax=Catenulispora yoronensis TaxID=450799 RepID=A0ABP5FE84_9ACTN